ARRALPAFPTRRSSDLRVVEAVEDVREDAHVDRERRRDALTEPRESRVGNALEELHRDEVPVAVRADLVGLHDVRVIQARRETRSEEHTSELQSPYDLV